MKNELNKKIDNLMILAQSSKEQGNLPNALNYLNKILELDSNNKRALNNAGNTCKEMQKFDEAISYYTKAINIDQGYIIAKINLAILHHDLGNLDKAEDLYKKMILLDKYNFAIYFNLSRINFEYFDEDKIGFIKNSINNENISDYNKASAYFILAKHEQMKKNFDKEIKFLDKGHRYLRKSFPSKVYEQSLNYWLKIIPKKFDKIEISNLKKIEKKDIEINPIFIIGMPRSGSTLVESIISSGELTIPNGGETATINWALLKNYRKDLFNKDMNKINIDLKKLRNDIIDKYQNLNLLDKNKKYFFTDKSLENFFYIDTILKLFPNAKFIHCKRNKIDNIFAIYQNFFTKMSWTHSMNDIIIYFNNYLDVMNYYNEKFKNKIFLVELENLTTSSEEITKKLFEFCKLEWSEKCLEYHKRRDLFSTTASNIQIREKIYKYNNTKYDVYRNHLKQFEQDYSWLKKDLL